ncbi:TPA: GNAT family N-acetyltransferase [Streptococcus suis]
MITYKQNPQLDFQAVLELYSSVGWIGYTDRPDMLRKSLVNSLLIISAFDRDELVGLIRVVGDGASILFIQDILVHPDYQRQGIGRKLTEMALAEFPDFYQIHLLTGREEKTMNFYRSLGFTAVEEIDCVAYTYLGK